MAELKYLINITSNIIPVLAAIRYKSIIDFYKGLLFHSVVNAYLKGKPY